MLEGFTPASSPVGFQESTKRDVASPNPKRVSADSIIHSWISKTPEIWSHLSGLTALSGKIAAENALNGLTANHIENIAQLPQFRHLFDSFKLVVLLYKRLREGNYLEAGITLLDLLSNAYLLYKYGLVPTIKDAIELVKKLGPIVEAIKSGQWYNTTVTGHGKFIYTIPNDGFYPVSGMTAVARTKIRFRYSDSTIMSALLPAKALGVLPSLANLWDLQKGSFLVDWFTNIGSKLDLVDSQIWALALEVEGSTSTIELTYPLSDTFLALDGVKPILSPRLVRFQRVVQPTVPSMYPSRYDFLPPSGITDWKVGVALAWQNRRA